MNSSCLFRCRPTTLVALIGPLLVATTAALAQTDSNGPTKELLELKMRMAEQRRLTTVSGRFAPVVNDMCADAIPIYDGSTAVNTVGATTDGDPDSTCNFDAVPQIYNDVWFCYASSCTGTVHVDVCSCDFDAKLAAYSGCTCPASGPVACNDDACSLGPMISFPAYSGDTFLIRLGGFASISDGSCEVVISCTGGVYPGPVATWHTVDGGGIMFSTSAGGVYQVGGTIGQHDAGPSSGPMTDAGHTYSLVGGFWPASQCVCASDLNYDRKHNGQDVQGFVLCFISATTLGVANCGCADLNHDGLIDVNDLNSFVSGLLSTTPCP